MGDGPFSHRYSDDNKKNTFNDGHGLKYVHMCTDLKILFTSYLAQCTDFTASA